MDEWTTPRSPASTGLMHAHSCHLEITPAREKMEDMRRYAGMQKEYQKKKYTAWPGTGTESRRRQIKAKIFYPASVETRSVCGIRAPLFSAASKDERRERGTLYVRRTWSALGTGGLSAMSVEREGRRPTFLHDSIYQNSVISFTCSNTSTANQEFTAASLNEDTAQAGVDLLAEGKHIMTWYQRFSVFEPASPLHVAHNHQ
ncbi:hypothetical protein C8R44DRAFT_742025 [Mycena epipterygia]|nr:hypothetical protein C8R44DRAFT_742025 [Mycena epipterygia]